MHPRLGKQQYKGEVDLKAFEAFQGVCKHPLIYNGDINSVEDIHHIQEQFPGLAGIMIGRGLLANPALALEYRQNRTLELDEIREKLQSMHKCIYNQYAEQLEGGDEQLLNKMKTFWEYLMPQADRKLLKAIHKSTSLNKYNQAILAFFNQR
jgi:tRNA-dihydrouridine synthase